MIGAGLSGLMSALVLAEAGYRPLVLARGYGRTHWLGGTIDVLPQADLRQGLIRVIEEQAQHPYARIGLSDMEAALKRFRSLMVAARYPYVGGLERNVWLPTALGALRLRRCCRRRWLRVICVWAANC